MGGRLPGAGPAGGKRCPVRTGIWGRSHRETQGPNGKVSGGLRKEQDDNNKELVCIFKPKLFFASLARGFFTPKMNK